MPPLTEAEKEERRRKRLERERLARTLREENRRKAREGLPIPTQQTEVRELPRADIPPIQAPLLDIKQQPTPPRDVGDRIGIPPTAQPTARREGRKGIFIERDGSQFFIPKREAEELQRRGELRLGETLAEQQREREFRGRLTAEPRELTTPSIKEELAEKILEPTSLEPESIIEQVAEVGLTVPVFIGNLITEGIEKVTGEKFGRTTAEDLAETPFGKILGTTITGAGALLLGALGLKAIPLIMKTATATKITAMVLGTSTTIKTFVAGAGIYIVGGKVFDFKRGEIVNVRGAVSRITGESSTVLSAVQTGGLTQEQGFEALRQMNADVILFEQTVKRLGNTNVAYRVSEEYLADMELARDVRLNILERWGGIEQIAIQGRPQLQPEELMYLMNQAE